MDKTDTDDLKRQVRDFWDSQSCDTQMGDSEKFGREYFEEIEAFRYKDQPFIHSFAQFTRYRDKRVLEVGFGAGTDFTQWLRAGAIATGIDLTPEALANLTHRIQVYGLPEPKHIQVGDAENLPFDDGSFDLGYSFGVLHHSPNTEKAISELVRVVAPGGEVKIMVYNRPSIYVINTWVKFALLKGKPWKSLKWALWNHMESVGTKGYTRSELKKILTNLPLKNISVTTEVTGADYLSAKALPPLHWLYRLGMLLCGYKRPWKPSDYRARGPGTGEDQSQSESADSNDVRFYGNRLGFFHCIHAEKR